MLELVLAAAALSVGSADQAQALVTSIAASIDQVRARQAALPPPKDDAERILRLGELDQAPLLKLVPPEGWFLSSKYGKQAAWAAFDIIQHSDLALQERFLPVIGRLVPSGEVPGQSYAMMYDRVEIQHDRPQLYGTQFRCDGGKWRPYPIKDFDGLDARRKAFGFDESFAHYKATYFDAAPPCPQTKRPPPPGMKLD